MEFILMFGAFIVVLLLLLATGVPVAVGIGLVGVIGCLIFLSPQVLSQLSNIAFTHSSSLTLIIVPLFVLMSEVISASPIGSQLFRASQLWLGRLPGALGMGTVLTCTGFAAVCGSSPVTAATVGKMAIPEMVKNGYDRRLALGATAAGGTIGILIPPSVALVLYGVITETSIGALFIAGIIPGLMIAVLLCLTIFIMVLKYPSLAPSVKVNSNWKEKITSLASVLPIIVLAIFVLGSIYFGITTPTEAGAVGAAVAILIVLLMGSLSIKKLIKALNNTVKTTGVFLFIAIGGLFCSFILNRLGVPTGLANIIIGTEAPGWLIILGINLLILILGMFLDPISILVITLPLFFPTVTALGYDPVWFGIMVTINMEIAAITPPVGLNLFVLKTVVPEAKMSEIISGSLMFVVPLLLGLILIILFPDIVLFLPSIMK